MRDRAAGPPERVRSLWSPTFLHVYLASFLWVITFNLMVLFPLFVRTSGGDDLDIGLLTAVAAGGGILLRWGIGPVWDRLPRRLLFGSGGVLAVAGFIALAAAPRLGWGLYAARLLNGAGLGLMFGVFFACAADLVPADRRAQGLGLFGTSGMAASFFGVRLGEWILQRWGFPELFGTAAAIGLLSTGLALLLPEPRRASPSPEPRPGPSAPPLATLSPAGEPSGPCYPPRGEWGGFLPLWALAATFGAAITVAMAFLAPFAAERGLAPIAPFFLAYSAAAIAIRLLGGALPDRWGRRRILWPSLISLAIGLVLIPHARESSALLLMGTLGGIGHGYGFPVLSAMIVDRARRERRGMHIGLFTGFIDVGGVIAAPLLGLVARGSGYGLMYRSSGAALFVVGTLLLIADWRMCARSRRGAGR